MQPVTSCSRSPASIGDRLTAAYSTVRDGFGGATERRAWGYAKVLSAYRPSQPNVVVADLNLGHESTGGVTVNAIDVLGIDGCDYADLARARSIAEREAPRLVAWLRGRIPGLESAQIGRYADTITFARNASFRGLGTAYGRRNLGRTHPGLLDRPKLDPLDLQSGYAGR